MVAACVVTAGVLAGCGASDRSAAVCLPIKPAGPYFDEASPALAVWRLISQFTGGGYTGYPLIGWHEVKVGTRAAEFASGEARLVVSKRAPGAWFVSSGNRLYCIPKPIHYIPPD